MLPDPLLGNCNFLYLASGLIHKRRVKDPIPANETTKQIALAIRL